MFSTEPTDYDLRFTLLGIPVRVSIWFWVLALFLGFDSVRIGMEYLVSWMIVVFVSVLVHEYGHALFARALGYSPKILLYHFGGLAMFLPDGRFTRWKAIVLALAGPIAGFLLAATSLVLFFLYQLWGVSISENVDALIHYILTCSILVNTVWSVFNLLPILPLDGGNVSKEICTYFSRYNGERYAAQIGAVVAGVACAWFLMRENFFTAMLLGSLCFQNIQIAQRRLW